MFMEIKSKYIQLVTTLLASLFLIIEKQKQRKLTQLPKVYHQNTLQNNEIVSLLSSVLLRKFRPSLFIGTRSMLNSLVALLPVPPAKSRFREIITIGYDGAQIGLDWEFPNDYDLKNDKRSIVEGPIRSPVVMILHGVNNDTSFGYIRKIMFNCTEKGYIAVGMNSRGSGGVELSTPRIHNAAYTNDLR
jgi:predicted alpha/beta-fold hydrolase